MRCAVIAAGSNSCRLLIARVDGPTLRVEHHDIRGTRLGEGVAASGKLAPQAMARTLEAIEEFAQLARQTDQVFVIGTSALREARNAEEFCTRVQDATGMTVRVLTEEEEGRASFDGALWALEQTGRDQDGPVTVVDVGGSSTEIASRVAPAVAIEAVSLQLGAVRMTERFFKHDPPAVEEIAACRTAVRLALERAWNARDSERRRATLVFVGGTADTAARMLHAYDPGASIHVATVRTEDLEDLLRLTVSLPTEQRKRLHGLPESRADILPAGLIIIDEIARFAGHDELMVSESDMLVGYLREAFAAGPDART